MNNMDYVQLVILVLMGFGFFKIKSLLFDNKQTSLNKKDLQLELKQEDLSKEILQLKNEIKKDAKQLTPEEIEEFWNKK